jgi:hypothetical protein
MLAAAKGDSEIIKTLISKGAKVDAKDEQGRTALTKAVSLGKIEAAKTLVSPKADLETKDNTGWTPLVHAFADMHINSAEFLMRKGAKAGTTDKYAYSLLNLMMKLSDKKMARFIDANLTE